MSKILKLFNTLLLLTLIFSIRLNSFTMTQCTSL